MNLLLLICFLSLLKVEENKCKKRTSKNDCSNRWRYFYACIGIHMNRYRSFMNHVVCGKGSYKSTWSPKILLYKWPAIDHTRRERKRERKYKFNCIHIQYIKWICMCECAYVATWLLLHGIHSVLSITNIPNKYPNKCNDYLATWIFSNISLMALRFIIFHFIFDVMQCWSKAFSLRMLLSVIYTQTYSDIVPDLDVQTQCAMR